MYFLWFSGAFGLQCSIKGGISTWPGNLDLVLYPTVDSLTELQPAPQSDSNPLTLENCVDDPVSLFLPLVRLFISVGRGLQ